MGSAATEGVTGGARRLLLVDDDELSREVAALVAAEAGFETESFESGEAAVGRLAKRSPDTEPDVILTDMQMPGISGDVLAVGLRKLCSGGTLVLAMSGSQVAPERLKGFDGFLLKPFTAEDLQAAVEKGSAKGPVQAPVARHEVGEFGLAVLSPSVYDKFAKGMPAAQVKALYAMCLDDARKRLEAMRQAAMRQDDGEYRRAAHAVKGGFSMVGALELAWLAAEMESAGLGGLSWDGPRQSPLQQFVAAMERLERMLEVKARAPGVTNA